MDGVEASPDTEAMVFLLAQQPPPPPNLRPGFDVGPLQRAMESLEQLAIGFLGNLPRFLIGLLFFTLFVLLGRLVRYLSEPRLTALRTPSFGKVFSALAQAGVVFLGLVVSLPVAFPSMSVAGVLGGLGLLSIAAGFAFQDILSNLLAGLLLIFRQPFVTGDQIEVSDFEGRVEAITIRETQLRTFDGRLVIIPNKDVYTNAIVVQTAFESVRTSVEVGVAYGTDLAAARRIAGGTLSSVDGVLPSPEPEVYCEEFGDSAIGLELRYWTRPQQAEISRVQDLVVAGVHDAFEDAGIDMPFTTVTLDAGESFARAIERTGLDGQAARRTTS